MKKFKKEIESYIYMCESLKNKQLSVIFRTERGNHDGICVNFKILLSEIYIEIKDQDIKRVFDMNGDYINNIAEFLKEYSLEYKERQAWSRYINVNNSPF